MSEQANLGDFTATDGDEVDGQEDEDQSDAPDSTLTAPSDGGENDEDDVEETPEGVPDEAERIEGGGGLGAEIYMWNPDDVEDDEDEGEEDNTPDFPSVEARRTDDGGLDIIHDGEHALHVPEERIDADEYIEYHEDEEWRFRDDDPTTGGPKTGPAVPTILTHNPRPTPPEAREVAGGVPGKTYIRAHRGHRGILHAMYYGSYHDGVTGFVEAYCLTRAVRIIERTWGKKNVPESVAVETGALDRLVSQRERRGE